MFTLTNFVLVLLLINTATFLLFGWDKMMAEAGRWRVSEVTLLGWSLFGGIAGAYLGRQIFRHKTSKKSFCDSLQTISLLQIGAVVFGTVFFFPTGPSDANANSDSNVHAVMSQPDQFAYYHNCDSARAAGAAPIYSGEPGYRSPLDRDNDGIACEPYYGR